MEREFHTASDPASTSRLHKIVPKAPNRLAVVTMGVKLGDEVRGYTRFRFLSELLVQEGFKVDLITSSFQHWEKAQRDTTRECYQNLPYRVVFIDEPGYEKNLDLKRIHSHAVAAKNLRVYFQAHKGDYDLIYSEIPPNDVARVCAETADEWGIPYIADINDLWPEAMRMVFDAPIISDIVYHSFTRDAHIVYNLLSAAVGTSDEYANRPSQDRTEPYPKCTVYVGNESAVFDAGVRKYGPSIEKPAGQIWAAYAGTLGASYDLGTLIYASESVEKELPGFRLKILGDGPERSKLEQLASQLQAPVDFLGYMPYQKMAAYLHCSDMTVNSLAKGAAQSIVTKIGDYLAAGHPLINTGSSLEFCTKVDRDGFGLNVEAGNAGELAEALSLLGHAGDKRKIMGARARRVAEREFDQPRSYMQIVELIRSLI
ncbi:MAG: glycosyltransferase [Eggerthellaceae bacterium]